MDTTPATTPTSRACANNDVAILAWNPGGPIANCLGFCVQRVDVITGTTTTLPSWVGFAGDRDSLPKILPDGRTQRTQKTTDIWPIQKFIWRDLEAKAGGTYRYVITAMIKDGGNSLIKGSWTSTTNPVTLNPVVSDNLACYFNRGILSTQALTEVIPLVKNKQGQMVRDPGALRKHLTQSGDPMRAQLGGALIAALQIPIARAEATGGSCYAALYELNDPDLVPVLKTPTMNLILSEAGVADDTNKQSRADLHANGNLHSLQDRFMPKGHIGHNKFVVCVDPQGNPEAVLTGSTNWTFTGTCGQSNNAILIRDAGLAAVYKDYWDRLLQDTPVANTQPTPKGSLSLGPQKAGFRAANAKTPQDFSIDGSTVRVWFSPNASVYEKTSTSPKSAVDINDVETLIAGAQQGILFLAFEPGAPSIVDAIAKAKQANAALFVRGAATSGTVATGFDTSLYHRDTNTPDLVVTATEIRDDFDYWTKELLTLGFAVIHDKICVIDPFSDNCVVVVGSHNLGLRASTNNDENLLIIRGHRALAAAYATHVMDVYDHYRWRFQLQKNPKDPNAAFAGLDPTAGWQQKYFTVAGAPTEEVKFWI